MMSHDSSKTDQQINLAESFFHEGLSPEEWVKNNGESVYCWSLDQVEYKNENLKAWILSVTKLLLEGDANSLKSS